MAKISRIMGFERYYGTIVGIVCAAFLVMVAGPAKAVLPVVLEGVDQSLVGLKVSEESPREYVFRELHEFGLVSNSIYEAMNAVADDPRYSRTGMHGLATIDFLANVKKISEDSALLSDLQERAMVSRSMGLAREIATTLLLTAENSNSTVTSEQANQLAQAACMTACQTNPACGECEQGTERCQVICLLGHRICIQFFPGAICKVYKDLCDAGCQTTSDSCSDVCDSAPGDSTSPKSAAQESDAALPCLDGTLADRSLVKAPFPWEEKDPFQRLLVETAQTSAPSTFGPEAFR